MSDTRKREIEETKVDDEKNIVEAANENKNDIPWKVYCKEITAVLKLALVPTLVFSILMAGFVCYIDFKNSN